MDSEVWIGALRSDDTVLMSLQSFHALVDALSRAGILVRLQPVPEELENQFDRLMKAREPQKQHDERAKFRFELNSRRTPRGPHL